MNGALLLFAAACLVATACAHSALGERRLIAPMIAARHGVLRSGYACFILRFAWHLTSVMLVLLASLLATLALRPTALAIALAIEVGVGFTAVGIYDGVATRGRHIGWWLLSATGLATLAALAV